MQGDSPLYASNINRNMLYMLRHDRSSLARVFNTQNCNCCEWVEKWRLASRVPEK